MYANDPLLVPGSQRVRIQVPTLSQFNSHPNRTDSPHDRMLHRLFTNRQRLFVLRCQRSYQRYCWPHPATLLRGYWQYRDILATHNKRKQSTVTNYRRGNSPGKGLYVLPRRHYRMVPEQCPKRLLNARQMR